MMQLFDIFIQLVFYGFITAAVTSVLLYRRLQSPTRTKIRIHMSGGTERTFDAVESGEEILWIQAGEKQGARVPIDILPAHGSSWGVHYRIFDIIHGADEVLRVPWLDNEIPAQYLAGDEAAKARYRRRVGALDAFKQLTAGLSSLNRTQMLIIFGFGWFAGAYIMPLLAKLG